MKSIYEEFLEKTRDGMPFKVNLELRTMRVGSKCLIENGKLSNEKQPLVSEEIFNHLLKATTDDVLRNIEELYKNYKYSVPSAREARINKKYFKALEANKLSDSDMFVGDDRYAARAHLEAYILMSILFGKFKWDEKKMGRWFWQSKSDPDLIILRQWVEGK